MTHPDFIFEPKWDGFRALAVLEDGAVRLVSRTKYVYKGFPELCKLLCGSISAKSVVLDGEIVFLGPDGRPRFYDLMRRRGPQSFYAFDILWLDGQDLRDQPLMKRKAALRRLVPEGLYHLRFTDHVPEAGVELFRAVCEMDLEGIVAKHKDAPYGLEKAWLKIKNPEYSQAEGRHELFEARVGRKQAHSENSLERSSGVRQEASFRRR